ncbi:polysaccharide biosynthesis tyrosine autokinase [Trinickia fusca]|uniref:Putative tyrosine-protein kinase EpsB n=1 Tax=Trinickia fusca TaxID=2419777 RepID=A0A494XBU0_9BURK|nr:polysaccharide biosynthesis tyrosine autokinase [Trinickia fusca]RKP48307.1 polysaccharide biosynthesis tyrosine autokinase [Trinickia fusca]
MNTLPTLPPHTSAPAPAPVLHAEDEDVVLGQLLRVLVEDVNWLLGVTLTIIAMAALYCFLAKPIYSADAHVRVEAGNNASQALTQTVNGGTVASGGPTLPTDAEIEMIKSRGVVGPVVAQCKLNYSVSPKTIPLLGTIAARLATPGVPARPWLGLSSYAWGGEVADVDSIDVPPALEGAQLTLTAMGGGHYTLHDPDGNLLIDGRVGQRESGGGVTIVVKQIVARPGTRFVVVRANDLDAITGFQMAIQVTELGKQTGIIEIELEDKNPQHAADIANALTQSYLRQYVGARQQEASKMLDFLKGEAPRLKADLERAEAALTAYQQQSGSINPSDEAKVYLEGSIQYEQQIAAMQLQIAALQQRFSQNHPVIQTAQEQLAKLEGEREKFSERFRNLPASEVKGVALQRDAKVAEDIYVLLLNRVQELSVQKAGTGGNVHLVDAALRPGVPVKPKKVLILSAAAMLGLIAGTGFVFLRRSLYRGIDDPEQIERTFGLPLYGLVPSSAEAEGLDGAFVRGQGRTRPILAFTRPNDVCTEALRSLRTSMQFALAEARNGVMVLTGPAPGIGRSFLIANIAVLFADSGKRVLVIDADMRRGTLDEYFGGNLEGGLSELLSGQISLEEAIRSTPVPDLSFIASGARPPNPSELLMSPRLQQYLDGLARRYDVILVDTPPVLAVTDASVIAALAGTSFIVLRSGMHAEADIAASLKRLATAGVQVQGGIFNGMPHRSRGFARAGFAAVREYLNP